ncbi:hypothetical protein NQ318_007063 [Aromia moschata]|uniref:Uncharacterized protein n=1 Tax=Aromia moschata TaxID=1265417 RepID=A0AAV8X702_9CUCU|nr:hypothetical protein NQ318_007063 [Aromia moschata]
MEAADWTDYKERLFDYFTANEINNDGRKREIFLSLLDEDAYRLMLTLCRPNRPETTPFSALVSLFDEHFALPLSVFAERYKFYSAKKV